MNKGHGLSGIAAFSFLLAFIASLLQTSDLAQCSQQAGMSNLSGFYQFLVEPFTRVVLLGVGFLGLLIEFITLSAVAGLIGMIALTLFFIAHISLGLAPGWLVMLFGAGMIFLGIEIFLIPGHGVSGIIGSCAVLSAIFLTISNPVQATISILVSLIVAGVIFSIVVKKLPHSGVWKNMALDTRQTSSEGYNSSRSREDLLGKAGVCQTDLRPSGKALIDGEKLDVVSDGSFLTKDSTVIVCKVEGSKIVVRQAGSGW